MATEAAIGMGLGLVAGAVWKVRLETREIRTPTRLTPTGPRHPARLTPAETKKYPHGPPSAFLDVRTRPRLTRLPRLLPQNWHWQTKREVEAFYAKGK